MAWWQQFVYLFIESAPFLLVGMFLAGVINQLVPSAWVKKTLGEKNSVLNAALIGAPLPLCSCSVIPVAMGIRRSGASKASTASFLVSTPETGVDSLGVTYALMGPVMTIARPIAAISSAIVTGGLIGLFAEKEQNTLETEHSNIQSSNKNTHTCCHSHTVKHVEKASWSKQIGLAAKYGFGKLLRDFMLWFLIGIFFAALISTYVPADFIAQYAQGVGAMLIAVIISIPMYVCATASTPIAVGLLMSGITPGAALVFMLTGPATNIATLMVIKNELGKKELVLYLIGIIASALCAGLILDYLFDTFQWQLNLSHGEHTDMIGLTYQLSAICLAFLILYQSYVKWLKK